MVSTKTTATTAKKGREGIPCSPKSLKEHLEAFSIMEEAINELYKKNGRRAAVPVAAPTKRTRVTVNTCNRSRKD